MPLSYWAANDPDSWQNAKCLITFGQYEPAISERYLSQFIFTFIDLTERPFTEEGNYY